MRWLTLYLRCRGVPAAAGAAAAGVLVLWWLGQTAEEPRLRLAVALLSTLVATVAFGPGLVDADPALERTASLPWPPRRAAHVLAVMATATLIAAAPALTGEPLATAALMIRNTAGLGGLLAVGAVWGAQWAWLFPVGWTLVVILSGPASGHLYQEILTWMLQPAATTSAAACAATIAVVGVVTHAVLGGRR
ncbi:hypothetical protein KBX50_03090 [Micromonospora sp. C51]|uniref:hypothetical protein n=1 Tax=Micromonospora sp. C51 TaxID=2824879 RepID=UPI001B389F8E|nr:hypothetical protein [Micromonospora sp. C51]MBQ1047473.1 hypothetical protein [Micromonospora sp. C51]